MAFTNSLENYGNPVSVYKPRIPAVDIPERMMLPRPLHQFKSETPGSEAVKKRLFQDPEKPLSPIHPNPTDERKEEAKRSLLKVDLKLCRPGAEVIQNNRKTEDKGLRLKNIVEGKLNENNLSRGARMLKASSSSKRITEEKVTFPVPKHVRNPNQLTESHRKKLLFAISKVLRFLNVKRSDERYKALAASLEKVLRPIFLKYHYKKCTSASKTMFMLAKKYGKLLVIGKSPVEILLFIKNEMKGKRRIYFPVSRYIEDLEDMYSYQ